MATVTVKEMVRRYLINNGYDGLVHSDGDCTCVLDDFMHCDGDCVTECVAGHAIFNDKFCINGSAWNIRTGKKP